MKAKIEKNGQIKTYYKIPSKYKSDTLNIAGGFDKLSTPEHEYEGFFEVITPTYDSDLQTLGEIFKDEGNNVFTYHVIPIVIDLEAEKTKRKGELTRAIEDEVMSSLGVAILEKLALGEPIPQATKDIVIALRVQEQETINEIDAFTDPILLKKYKIKREDVEASKDMLKSTRKLN